MLKQHNLSQRIICGVALLAIAGLMISMPGCGKPGGKTGAKTGTKTGAETGTKTGGKTGTETGAKTGGETETKTGAETATKTGAQSGNNSSEKKRIIILTNGTSPFWDAAKKGAQDAARDLKVDEANLLVVVHTGNFKDKKQIDKLREYGGATDIVAIGISVTNSSNSVIAEEMRKLLKAGIKVITIDSDVDLKKARDARIAYLGTDNVYGGKELGKAAKGLRPNGGKYATFVGLKGAANAKERISGFAQGAGDQFESLESYGDGGDHVKARKNVRDAIDRNANINTLVGIWSYNAPAIVAIVKQLDRRKDMTIVTFDAEPPAINHMEARQIDAMVVQNPYMMGYEGVRMLKALVEDDKKTIAEMQKRMNMGDDKDIYDTGLKVIIPDADTPLKPEMFAERTEVITLTKFKEWLKSKGLRGS